MKKIEYLVELPGPGEYFDTTPPAGKKNLPIKYNGSYPNGIPYISIVMSTFNKAGLLDNTLASIRANQTDIPYEIIVVDDGSTDNTFNVCKNHSVSYVWINGGGYRNPAVPRNIGCRTARGELLILQSDDVLHESVDTIETLANLERGSVNFASVWNVDQNLTKNLCYCHEHKRPAPFFFLGSIHKDDFWSIGGNDEDFTAPGYEDEYLGEIIKRKYKINWRNDVVGLHQNHARPRHLGAKQAPSKDLFGRKMVNIDQTIQELK